MCTTRGMVTDLDATVDINTLNYYSPEANKQYWSVSQFKAFDACEAAGLASALGVYKREDTTALLVGSYVDAYFSGTLPAFIADHPEIMKRDGSLKAEYVKAAEIIDRVESDELMSSFLKGSKQVIRTGILFDVPWKIRMDVYDGARIVDLKVMKDMKSIYSDGFGRRSFIEHYGYDIQGAVYQKIEQLSSGRANPLPFYLAVATKEKEPDIAVIQIPQHVLDSALKTVEAKIDRFDLVKQGLIEPTRCGDCDYCRLTKKLTAPVVYDPEEWASR